MPAQSPKMANSQLMAILSLILGIVGLVVSFIPYFNFVFVLLTIPSIVLGIIALVKAIKNHTAGKGCAIAGLACSLATPLFFSFTYIAIQNCQDFLTYRNESRILTTREIIKSIDTATSMYHLKHGGKYPDSLDALTQETEDDEALIQGDNVVDPWGTELRYERRGKRRPRITSAGPDGEFDTSDDITNYDGKP